MKFTLAAALSAILFAVPSIADSVSFDTVYDNKAQSLATVACSDGSNGLLTKGFKTFGDLPSFPNIGGAAAVTGFNSAGCGTCWALTFNGTTVNVLAIDVASPGFNIAEAAMNTLTKGQAVFLGRVNATAKQVAASVCGL